MSDISSELLQCLERKAEKYTVPKNSWEGYAILLKYWNNAFQRIPTPEDLEATDDTKLVSPVWRFLRPFVFVYRREEGNLV